MGQSRPVIALVVVALSLALPALLCAAVVIDSATSFANLVVHWLAAAACMTLLALVNWWEFTSVRLRWAWFALLAAGILWRLPAATRLPLTSAIGSRDVVALVLAAAAAWLAAKAIAARRHEGDALDLAFPLSDGRFLVTDGGDGAVSFLINYHYGFGRHRASGAAASMRYAIDAVQVGPFGCESAGFLPRRNAAYIIWQKEVTAPCDGRVVHAVNDVEDNDAFGSRRPYGVGNHVVVRCAGDAYVVLGHLRCGSVAVRSGDDIRAGDRIGAVGNSGWTERPHLHMQAMRSRDGDWWHGGALPIRFDGRFLVRNQTVRVRLAAPART
jgi:hypothetical protein